MIYQVHNKPLNYNGKECGLYKSPNSIKRMEYAVMDMTHLINTINGMPVEKAIEAVTQLKDLAVQQAKWQTTPQNPEFPILIQVPGPSISINEVRENILNTERFCTEVLRALNGK